MQTEKDDEHVMAALSIMLNENRPISIPVEGKSMYPLIDDLDRVAVVSSPPDKIKKGDIIVFRNSNGIVIHRALKLTKNEEGIQFCQKGDSSPYFRWISGENVLGRWRVSVARHVSLLLWLIRIAS